MMMRKAAALSLLALAGCIYYRRPPAEPAEPPVTREEAERLAAAGISDAVILETLDRRGARKVSSDDLVALKKAGASDAVLERIVSAERPDPPVVVVEEPTYYHRHYHYPWPLFGFGFGYSHWGRRGGWGFRFCW